MDFVIFLIILCAIWIHGYILELHLKDILDEMRKNYSENSCFGKRHPDGCRAKRLCEPEIKKSNDYDKME